VAAGLLTVLLLAPAAAVHGEEAERDEAAPAETAGPGTPRGAVAAYLDAVGEGALDEAARYLAVPGGQHGGAGELARKLHEVLEQAVRLDLEEMSSEPEGRLDDGLSPDRERIGAVAFAEDKVPVLLARTRTKAGGEIWRFAPETVSRVGVLHEAVVADPVSEQLPRGLSDWKPLAIPLWKWLVLLALVPAAGLAAWLVVGVLRWLSPRVLRLESTEALRGTAGRLAPPLRLMLAVALFASGEAFLALPITAGDALSAIELALAIAAGAWLATRILDALAAHVEARLRERGQGQLVALVPLGRRSAKIAAMTVTGLALLGTVGLDVTAVIAGLGVGGLAVALAAQKPLENLFSGVTLFADQPVRVGDFCRFGDRIGTVENIGLRSTKVRTLDRTVVSVPNTEFSTIQLENYARRDQLWYHPKLGLRYETTPDQIRYVLVEVRRMLYAHPRVDPDPARIRFVGFGAYSLDLEIFAYVQTTDYGEFLEIAEDLNLRIMDIVARAGTGFAFPSVTAYLEQGEGMPKQRAEEVTEEVAAWREQRALYLPRFPEEQIESLRGRLDYPPHGSPWNGPER
jgi:MscS family membrane protein